MRIAIVTATRLPHPDDDQPLLDAALHGHDVTLAAWDDEAVDWAHFDVAVIRSTWNYIGALERFLAWSRRVSTLTRLRNSAATLAWNSDKAYLTRLDGAPVIPTLLFDRGASDDLATIARAHDWSRVVVKPRVSAGSFETHRFDVDALQGGELARCAAQRDVLVQPYVRSVEGWGERSLVFIGGQLSHAVRKSPRFSTDEENTTRAEIADDEREVAMRVLSLVAEPLLYARVDLARDDAGRPQLMELELIEPSLFLRYEPSAAKRLAEALTRT
jgi:hypothetical protein